MEQDHIARLIERLDREIETASSLSPHDLALLQDLRRDIEKVLTRSGGAPSADNSAVMNRLRVTTERFEAAHPNLTAAMAHIMDSLVKLGI
jgi:hypothetical protein